MLQNLYVRGRDGRLTCHSNALSPIQLQNCIHDASYFFGYHDHHANFTIVSRHNSSQLLLNDIIRLVRWEVPVRSGSASSDVFGGYSVYSYCRGGADESEV
jgi:hypothetical protein